MDINQPLNENILQDFFASQLADWDLARTNVEALKTQVVTRRIPYGEIQLQVQFNPARIVSTGAKVDKKSIAQRACFLCADHRPAVQQEIEILDNISVLLNPFPILPSHLTIPSRAHVPQQIGLFEKSIGQLAEMLPSHIIFYNGPRCGASAPDHAHLQAGAKGYVPIERDWATYQTNLELLYSQSAHTSFVGGADISLVHHYACPAFAVQSDTAEMNAILLHRLTRTICQVTSVDEADINVLTWKYYGRLVTVVFVRSKHRPDCYTAEGDAQILVSPGSIDMGGLFITPRQEDFNRLTPQKAYDILREVSATEEVFETISTQITNWD